MHENGKKDWKPADPNNAISGRLAGARHFSTSEYMHAIMGEKPTPQLLHEMARELKVYESTLAAYYSGEALPSEAFIDNMGKLLGIPSPHIEAMKVQAHAELADLRKKDPHRALLVRVIGQATTDTLLQGVLHKLLFATGGTPPKGEVGFSGKELCELATAEGYPISIPGLSHLKIDTPDPRRVYSDKTVSTLTAGFGIQGTGLGAILRDIAKRNTPKTIMPFGKMLEAYMQGGGKSLGEFLTQVISADKGWDIPREKFAGRVGLSGPNLARTIKKSKIDKESVIQKFVDAFRLASPPDAEKKDIMGRQERLFWQLARGDMQLPSEEQIIRDAQKELKKLEEETDPAETTRKAAAIARKAAIDLWDRSGLTFEKLGAYTKSTTFLRNLRNNPDMDLPNYQDPRCMDRLAEGVILSGAPLKDEAANVFRGMAELKTSARLMQEVRNGKTYGYVIRTVRKQKRMSQKEFAAAIPYNNPERGPVSLDSVGEWERNENKMLHDGRNVADAVATLIGFDSNDDRADFIAAAMGRPVSMPAQKTHQEWLLEIRGGGTTFSQFLQALLTQRRQTQKELAADIGTSPANISHWLSGGHIRFEEQAREFAHFLGYTEPADERDFMAFATGGCVVPAVSVTIKEPVSGKEAGVTVSVPPLPAGETQPLPQAPSLPILPASTEVEFLPDDKKWVWRPESQVLGDLGFFYDKPPAAPPSAKQRRAAVADLINITLDADDPDRSGLKLIVASLVERVHEAAHEYDEGNKGKIISDITRRQRRSEILDQEIRDTPAMAGLERDVLIAIKTSLRPIIFPDEFAQSRVRTAKVAATITDPQDVRRQALRLIITELMSDTEKRYELASFTDPISRKVLPSKPGGFTIRELIGYHKFQSDYVANRRYSITSNYGNETDRAEDGLSYARRTVAEGSFMDPRVVKGGIITPGMVETKIRQLLEAGEFKEYGDAFKTSAPGGHGRV